VSSSENYPLFAELSLFEMHVESVLKFFRELTNAGRKWTNSTINLAV